MQVISYLPILSPPSRPQSFTSDQSIVPAKWRNSPTLIPPHPHQQPYHPLPQPTQLFQTPQRLGQQNVQPTSSPFAYPPPPLYPPNIVYSPLSASQPPFSSEWLAGKYHGGLADWRWCRLCVTVNRRLGRMMSW